MQTLSSASRTCIASASAVECTATVEIPSSLHARRMRKAISPRLAISILSNIISWTRVARVATRHSALFDDYQRFAEFDRLAILDENLRHGAGPGRGNLFLCLHRLDDQQRLPRRNFAADFNER